jgi:hypothetical protein
MAKKSKPLRTQQDHIAEVKARGTMLGLDRHITPSKVPSFKQQKIAFRKAPLEQPPPALILEAVLEEGEDDGAKELLMDALISEACGDDDILEEPMTIQAVFDSV